MPRLTIDEAAKRLDRTPEMVRRWIREGRLRGEKFGNPTRGVWLVQERQLERFRRNEPRRRTERQQIEVQR